MNTKTLISIITTLTITGCVSPSSSAKVDPPKLNEFSKENPSSKALTSALNDFTEAAQYCRRIHNNYERASKNVESYKTVIGGTGGVLGTIGAVLVGAGTGGYFPGIASGLAGAASTTLAASEAGPLGTSFYLTQKNGIAATIHKSSQSVQDAGENPEKIVTIAHALAASCLAAAPGSE